MTRPGPRIFYGWVVLAAAVALVTVGFGITFSLAVFLKPLEEEFGWSRALIAGIALMNWLIFGACAFAWGTLSDRIGTRRVVAMGAGLLGAAMLLSSQVGTAWQLYAAFGVLGAAGSSAFYVPLSASVTRWFAATCWAPTGASTSRARSWAWRPSPSRWRFARRSRRCHPP